LAIFEVGVCGAEEGVDPQLPIDLGGGEAVGNNAVFMMAYLRPVCHPKK
jgi:hypothetical protein